MARRRGWVVAGLVAVVVVAAAVLVGLLVASRDGSASPGARRPSVGDVPLAGHAGSPGRASWTAWPQALHDAQHTGAARNAGPVTGRVRWKRQLEGDITPGPVIAADGTIYAASNAGVLHAIDPATGADRWTLDGKGGYGSDQSTSPAVLPNGTVLWPGPDAALRAVSPKGHQLWQLRLGGPITSPAVTASGLVAVGDAMGRLLELRPTTTAPRVAWDVDLHERTYGSPVIAADGRTVYQSVVSGVVAVRDGRTLWRSKAPRQIVEVSPAVAPDGTVVVGTNDPYQYGLDPGDGHVRWRYRRGRLTYSSPGVTSDGVAYFGDHANRITGLDARTGRLVFRFQGSTERRLPGGVGIWTSVVVDSDHRVYVGTRQGLVYAVDRRGRLLWQLQSDATVESYPALTSDGALVVGTSGGTLMAIADR